MFVGLWGCDEPPEPVNGEEIERSADSGSMYRVLGKEEFDNKKARAENGDAKAAHTLAYHYVGKGTNEYESSYMFWLKKSDQLGNPAAGREIAYSYLGKGLCQKAEKKILENAVKHKVAQIETQSDLEAVKDCRNNPRGKGSWAKRDFSDPDI